MKDLIDIKFQNKVIPKFVERKGIKNIFNPYMNIIKNIELIPCLLFTSENMRLQLAW